ncbi:uncharacterized protein N7498_004223 [Penicillium cinerascens]|uniref:Uncharacterized protein n=1 Tax=Penicillium cinerascens TaxID=70096 RepID=A0A9W9N3L6_9EURO|nr:uncharacterized protein N7498_004223 [Penicillium cinerascens]KAJ5212577.1 hypothetical protein N7498_004223 [Penicillium cinerascens]
METSKDEPAPSYADIFQGPANFSSGYSRVTQDEPDVEAGPVHEHGESGIPLNPRPVDSQGHVHCEVCDAQTARREKQKADQHTCNIVSVTIALIFLFVTVFGMVTVTAVTGSKKE